MANDTDTVVTSECSVCGENFANFQECFKHELVKHSLQNKADPNNRVQKRLNATAKFLNGEEKVMERERLKVHLKKCKSGEELRTIFDLFCMKTDNLSLIFTRIQTCLEKELISAGIVRIYPFGSVASGLALRDCDIDIFLDVSNVHTSPTHKHHAQNINDKTHQRKAFNRISRILHCSTHFTDVYAIRGARVPIIKCKHKDTGFSIDINVSYPSSRENTQFIYDLIKTDERIHAIMLFLKLWAKNTQIIGRDNMTSYCLITMVIFFLQQPRKSEIQTSGDNNYRILKSIKELQQNCTFHIVQGINYAYDLNNEENKIELPASVTTWDLIKEFFDFYQNFNFEDNIISPYYGKSVAKSDLTPEICEDYYKQLRTITQYLQGEQANHLQLDRCLCVQDAFCLNQNTAKTISFQNRQYIVLCLKNAQKICENPNKLQLGQLYEQLLFETINVRISTNDIKEKTNEKVITDLENLKLPTIDTNRTNNNECNLVYTRLPSKADLRAVSSRYPNIVAGEEILRSWCQHYVHAIQFIMTKIYRIDIQKQHPTQQKQLKLDEEEKNKELNKSWLCSCTIDLWSKRCFQKKLETSFLFHQLEQTERLHALRRQDQKFSVTLNGILKLNILPNYKGIDIQISLTESAVGSTINKKSPLRKFFNIFKNTLQSCSFKEILNIDDTSGGNNNEAVNDTVLTTENANG